jgi:hypothetical protein
MRGVWRLAVVLLVAGTGCATKERPPVTFESTPWKFAQLPGVQLTTAHYEIYTTVQDPVLRAALPGFVEAAFENYAQLVPPTHTPSERMRIYLFASRAQWAAFTRRFAGARAKVLLQIRNGGYSERGVSVMEYVAHQITFPLLAHEGFHQYLYYYVNANIPAWLNEGLAVCCEGQRWGTWGIDHFDPGYNPMRRNDLAEALVADKLHPLSRLLETDAGKIVAGSNQSVATYYAQLWALILFLREGEHGRYAAGFQRMLGTLDPEDMAQHAGAAFIGSKEPTFSLGRELFRDFISGDLDTVEREYLGFMRARFLEKG